MKSSRTTHKTNSIRNARTFNTWAPGSGDWATTPYATELKEIWFDLILMNVVFNICSTEDELDISYRASLGRTIVLLKTSRRIIKNLNKKMWRKEHRERARKPPKRNICQSRDYTKRARKPSGRVAKFSWMNKNTYIEASCLENILYLLALNCCKLSVVS